MGGGRALGDLRRRSTLIGSIALVLASDAITPTAGAEPSSPKIVQLKDAASLVLEHGVYPAPAGDVNGDGHEDVAVSSCTYNERRGVAYVVFGPGDDPRVDLGEPGEWGFTINGPDEGGLMCRATTAGDVNGDGLADVIVGAPSHHNAAGETPGMAYVVFGKTDTDTVELADFDRNTQGTRGFRIEGTFSRDRAGEDVTGVGDLNGDGLDDFAISAPFAGATYVVFGKSSVDPVLLSNWDLGIQGPAGYRVETPVPGYNDLYSVEGIGDTNGDGLPDIGIGVMLGDSRRGSLYVTFGKSDPEPIDVTRLGNNGYRVLGRYGGSLAGYSSAGIGDVNGDSKDDIIVGAPSIYGNGAGSISILYGKESSAPIHLRRLGKHGYSILGVRHFRNPLAFGYSVAGVGDVNGDGVPDAAVGAPAASFNRRKASGAVYIVHIDPDGKTMRVADFRKWGRRFDGPNRLSVAGADVGFITDFTGDGRANLAVNVLEDKPQIPATYVITL